MAQLSNKDILHLSHLARLELTDEEVSRFATQLSGVVGYVDQLSAIKTNVEAQLGVTGMKNVMGIDEERLAGDLCDVSKADLLAGAPASNGDYILVKAVLADDGGGA